LLKRLKHARCTTGEEVSAVVKGDTLIYTYQLAGKPGERMIGNSEGWAWGYNELRVTEKLGGPCVGTMMGDAAPACEKARPGVVARPKRR
jgi:hypothetical protein